VDGVVDEDEATAFMLFSQAAENQHTGAMFLAADCLFEGTGCDKDKAKAVSLMFAAAERGHRYARQRIRELLRDHP
jgi:TPR repeat protein